MTQHLVLLIEQHLSKAIHYEHEANRALYFDSTEDGEQVRDELLDISRRAFQGALVLEQQLHSEESQL